MITCFLPIGSSGLVTTLATDDLNSVESSNAESIVAAKSEVPKKTRLGLLFDIDFMNLIIKQANNCR